MAHKDPKATLKEKMKSGHYGPPPMMEAKKKKVVKKHAPYSDTGKSAKGKKLVPAKAGI